MKKFIRLSVIVLAMALLQTAQASPYTNYLDEISNVVAYANATLPTEAPAKVRALLSKAARDFQKPSTSVAGDYKIFVAVATHLMPLEALVDPGSSGAMGGASSNAFTNFVLYATAQVEDLSVRIEAITPLQGLRRAASNQLAGAIRSLTIAATTTNINVGILSMGAALNKLVVAQKLTERAEANQGFAVDSLDDQTLTYIVTANGTTDTFYFSGGTYASTVSDPGDPEHDYGTYTYERTGLSTALLTVQNQNPNNGGTTTVKIRFTSKSQTGETEGTFIAREQSGRLNKGTCSTAPTP